MTTLSVLFGKRVKEIRESKNIKQIELANMIDVEATNLRKLEKGVHLPKEENIYETECRIASLMIQKEKPYPDRDEMQKYADYLKVKYVFLFDEEGKVIVTNSNYDHLQVGSTPEEPFYDFQPLLEGTDSVIMPPEKDERHQEYLQYNQLLLS